MAPSKAKLAQRDGRPAIQNTRKITAAGLPLHFKAMGAIFHSFQQPGTLPGQARLITIAYSHYVERVRWVLDLSPLRERYTEDAHPPGLSMFAVQSVTDGAESSTPTLVLADGEVLHDSNTIVPRLAELHPKELGWLYPTEVADDVREYEATLAEVLGANIRQLAYTHLLEREVWAEHSRVGGPISRHTSWIEMHMYALASGRIGHTMKKLMRCHENRIDAATAALDGVFAEASRRLSKHRFLCGETLTSADITFAALAYPCVFPPEHAPVDVVAIEGEEASPPFVAIAERFRATPAGKHAQVPAASRSPCWPGPWAAAEGRW